VDNLSADFMARSGHLLDCRCHALHIPGGLLGVGPRRDAVPALLRHVRIIALDALPWAVTRLR